MTSATGYVGTAVAARLRMHGHTVASLARSAQSIERLQRSGIEPVPGELAVPRTYARAAAAADVIIHTAFEYLTDGSENIELDTNAAHTLVAALGIDRARRLIYTSNGYLPGVKTEYDSPPVSGDNPRTMRFEVERMVLAGSRSSSSAVIRLGMVYGGHGGGTIASLFASARRSGQLCYPRDVANNRWSLIHLDDMAELYATLVATKAPGVFHAVDGIPISVKRALECSGAVCGVPVSVQGEVVARSMLDSHAVDIMKRDVALSAPRANALGWSPRYCDFELEAAQAYATFSRAAASGS